MLATLAVSRGEGRSATYAALFSHFSPILKVSPTKDFGLSFAGVMLQYLICTGVVIDELEAGIGIEPSVARGSHFGVASAEL
jgi:hypothetical protein